MTSVREYQEQTGQSVFSSQNQNILRKFVEREVVQNISMLVQHLLEHPDCFSGSDYHWDDLLDLGRTVDWEEAAIDALDDWTSEDCRTWIDDYEEEIEQASERELKDIILRHLKEDEGLQDFVEEEGVDIDPYEREALEFWIVSDFLQRKLGEKGEATTDNLFGLTVWGRTTSGQAILLDSVIAEIALDMEILVGQRNEWKI